MTDYRWNKDTRKTARIYCPECKLKGTLQKRKYNENIDYYWCKECSKEWWETEIIVEEYSLGVFRDEQTGKDIFVHYSEGWQERREERDTLRKTMKLPRKIRRAGALRKKDINLLRKLREK